MDLWRATLAILEKITPWKTALWFMDVEFSTASKISGSQKILKSGT